MGVTIPPELLYEILSHMSRYDTRSLRNCSLVARAWVHPSRRRLFEVIDVRSVDFARLWLKNVSPTNIRLLRCIRSLHCKIENLPNSPHDPTDRIDIIANYSPSLSLLGYLSMTSGRLLSLDQIGSPSAFQYTLTELVLTDCRVAIRALIALINHFSNLIHLRLVALLYEKRNQPNPPLSSRPLQSLSLRDFRPYSHPNFINELSALRLQCDAVSISGIFSYPSLAQLVVSCVEANVKCLDLQESLGLIGNPLTLSNCRQLRKLSIRLSPPGDLGLDLLSSITSTSIEKITFTLSNAHRFPPDHICWSQVDSRLCQLADRLGRQGLLEIEIRLYHLVHEARYMDYLLGFHEKGQVRVVHVCIGSNVHNH